MLEILFSAIILAGCGYLKTPVSYTRVPTWTHTATITVKEPHYNLLPTHTPAPTEFPSPTITFTPTGTVTPTSRPGTLDCISINSKHVDGMTDLQLAEYADSINGKVSHFSGRVSNVNVNSVVELVSDDQRCNFLIFNIPTKQARLINKDQYLEGYGAIIDIDYVDRVVIQINILLDTLLVR